MAILPYLFQACMFILKKLKQHALQTNWSSCSYFTEQVALVSQQEQVYVIKVDQMLEYFVS